MDNHSEREIPEELALKDVFFEYIQKCLGKDGLESDEYKVLRRIIELMYEKTRSQLELAIIKQDVVAGRYVAPDISSPYANLVDEVY